MTKQEKEAEYEKYKRPVIGVFVIGIALILLLCSSNKDANPITYNGYVEEDNTTQSTAVPETQFKTVNLKGAENSVTKKIGFESGGYKISATNDGDSNFLVTMLDEQGKETENSLIVNEIGPTKVSQAINVESGKYFFNVEADGNWTIKIEALK